MGDCAEISSLPGAQTDLLTGVHVRLRFIRLVVEQVGQRSPGVVVVVVRVQPDRLGQVVDGLLVLAYLVPRNAPVEPGVGARGVKLAVCPAAC